MSVLPSGSSGGRTVEDRSQTDACIVPTGGFKYRSLCYNLMRRMRRGCMFALLCTDLDEFDGVRGVVVSLQVKMRVLVGTKKRKTGTTCP